MRDSIRSLVKELVRQNRNRRSHLMRLLASYESAEQRIQVHTTTQRRLVGKILGGNDELMMFEAEPSLGLPDLPNKVVHIVVDHIVAVEPVEASR